MAEAGDFQQQFGCQQVKDKATRCLRKQLDCSSVAREGRWISNVKRLQENVKL